MTTPDAGIRDSAASLAKRARLDLLSIALLLVGAGGFAVSLWLVDWRAGLAVVFLYIAGAGVAVGMDRQGVRT